MEGPTCIGCQKFIEEGSVIAFGESLFHIKCFVCAKCNEAVDCDSNLLLLSNGKPVCENCSYLCHACKQVIRDEAIMTGDDAYHAECFQCVSCKKKIEDLVFTQTSKGIHCTPCHEKRKAEKQRRREEREKRLQLKQQHKQAKTEGTQQQPQQQQQQQQPLQQLDTSIIPPNTLQAADPPTPSRSRSNSIDDSHGKYLPKLSNPATSTATPNSPPSTTSDYNITVNTTPNLNSSNSPPLSISSPTTTTKSMTVAAVDHISSTLLDKPTNPMLELDSLNLSFFDNDSNDLVNLTKQLGANISMDIYGNHIVSNDTNGAKQSSSQQQKTDNKTTENRITRASQLLESSLVMMSDFAMDGFPSPPPKDYSISTTVTSTTTANASHATSQQQSKPLSPLSTFISAPDSPSPSTAPLNSSTTADTIESSLRAELQAAQAKIQALQASHEKIKDASRKALDELSRAKEEFTKEVQLRQQQEYLIHQLKHQLHIAYQSERFTRPELSVITKEEIERVAHIRVELDKTCNELKNYRNLLIQDIDALSTSNHSDKLGNMLTSSFKQDQEQLRTEIKHLEEIRDDILHEMVMLNTKNAELTEMNNDLSRRMTEREREAAAVMAGTSFIYPNNSSQLGVSPTPSISSEIHASPSMMMQRKSSEASIRNFHPLQQQQQQQATPKMFKLKKKGGNMFSKLSGKSKSANNANAISENAAAAAIMYGHHHQQQQQQQQQQYYNTSSTLSLLATNNNNNNNQTINASSLPLNSSSCSSSTKASLDNQQQQQQQQHGSHLFLPTSFLRPSTKCDACGDKMWGFVTNELRCQQCLYTTHARCLSFVPQLCQAAANSSTLMLNESTLQLQRPSNESDISNATGGIAITTDATTNTATATTTAKAASNNTNANTTPPVRMKLFGTDLAERAQFESRTIPYIIDQCIKAVEKRGMDYEGIYRKSGGAAQIRTIVQAFENMDYHPPPSSSSSSTSSSSLSTSLSSSSTTTTTTTANDNLIPPLNLQDDDEINDICAVTSVLKQYFRDLPNPLIPYNLYTLFIDAVSKKGGSSQVDTFSELLSRLPQVNHDTLRVLIQHLHQVQSRHHENLMTIKNLAMVFGPTLLRDEEANRDLIDMSFKNAVVEMLITHNEVLFSLASA